MASMAKAKSALAEVMRQRATHTPAQPGAASALPAITTVDKRLRELTEEALTAVMAANSPPVIFQHGNTWVRLKKNSGGAPHLDGMTEAAVRGYLDRVADWLGKGGPVRPPMDVVRDVMALPEWPLPNINGIIETPVFGPDGALLVTEGYHSVAEVYLHIDPGFKLPPVPEHPTTEEIVVARQLILDDLLGEFPFADGASRAHTLAMLLLPFLRLMIAGPTPLHLIDASSPGTGKTLLVHAVVTAATGRPVSAMVEGRDDEEWRKRLTAVLRKAPTHVLIDNVRRKLDSGSLSAAITCSQTAPWEDRVLGTSRTVTLPVTSCFLATANNAVVSEEIARRTIWIRLDAKVDRPWERTDFRHNSLLKWANEHRGELVWAALTLCQAWITAGRPPGTHTLGGFEAWSRTVGGVLDVCGVPGILTNAGTLYEQADEDSTLWRQFVKAWWQTHQDMSVRAGELYDLAVKEDLMAPILGSGNERSQRIKLGRALGQVRDRIIGGYRIESQESPDYKGRRLWRLQPAPDTPRRGYRPSTDVAPGGDDIGSTSVPTSVGEKPRRDWVSGLSTDVHRCFPGSDSPQNDFSRMHEKNGDFERSLDANGNDGEAGKTEVGKTSVTSVPCSENRANTDFPNTYVITDVVPMSSNMSLTSVEGDREMTSTPENVEPSPRECPVCGEKEFWLSRWGKWTCRVCHPPAPRAEVASEQRGGSI